MMQPHARRFVVAVCTLAFIGFTLAGCSAVTASSYLVTRGELPRYATFGWGAANETSTGDPRLDNNPLFNDRVQADVERGLTAYGYALAPSGTPDFVVRFHASMSQEIDTQWLDEEFCTDDDCWPFVSNAGTLYVDLIDGATGTLVWRGWANCALGDVIGSQAAMERRIDESIAQILARLPERL